MPKVSSGSTGQRSDGQQIGCSIHRVVFVNPTIFPYKDSTAVTDFSCQKGLEKQGVSVRVYARADNVDQLKVATYVRLYKTLVRRRYFKPGALHFLLGQLDMLLFSLFCLHEVVRDRGSAVIVQHLWSQEVPISLLVLSLFRPAYAWYQGGALRKWYRENAFVYWYLAALYKLALRRANVLLESRTDQEHIDYATKTLKMASDRVHFLAGTPADDDTFHPLAGTQENRTRDKIVLLCVGRLEASNHVRKSHGYEKDPFTFLQMFARICRLRNDVELWFAGTGAGLCELRERAARDNIQSHIRFLGHLSKERLAECYHRADLTVVPHPLSSLLEAGCAIRESLASGVPVAAFKHYPWLPCEQPGGFLITYDAEIGFKELEERLNLDYLGKKQRETKLAIDSGPYTATSWGIRAKSILFGATH